MSKSTIAKKTEGYGYKYTELADINKYCEENGILYYQDVDTCEINGKDYIITYIYDNDSKTWLPHRGCQIVEAVLQGIKNPVQEYGSSLTYCRRYSLLMALGLATEDDNGASLTTVKEVNEELAKQFTFGFGKFKGKTMEEVLKIDAGYVDWFINNKADEYAKKCYELLSGVKVPTDEELDQLLKLKMELHELENEFDIPHEKTLEIYKVNSENELTAFQLTDAIANIKKLRKEG